MAEPEKKSPNFLETLQADVGAEAAPAFQWLLDHARLIATAVVAVVAVAIIVGGWRWHAERKIARAHLDMGLALVNQKGAARLQALEQLKKEAPARLSGVFSIEGALGAAEIQDEETAALLWQEAAQDISGPFSTLSSLAAANAMSEAGRNQEALALLEKLATTADSALVPLVRAHFAHAAERCGEHERAAAAYAQLAGEARSAEEKDFYKALAYETRKQPGNK